MSMKLVVDCWELRLDKTSKYVLMGLCDSADDDGSRCFPSPQRIAHKTDVHVSTVYRVIEWLLENTYLEQVGMHGDTPEYHIHLERVPRKPPFEKPRRGRPRKNPSQPANDFAAREKNSSPRKIVAQGEKDSQAAKNRRTVRKSRPLDGSFQTASDAASKRAGGARTLSITQSPTPVIDPIAREPIAYDPENLAHVRLWQNSREGRAFLFSRKIDPSSEKVTTIRYMLRKWIEEGEAIHA